MASQTIIEEIRSRLDIVDFIGSYVSLKRMGKYFKAPCPFHQEKTPSFVVSQDRQRWHCFGACHEGGDIFAFLMKWDNLSFPEVVQELGKRAGIAPEDLKSNLSFSDAQVQMKDTIYEINAIATKYLHYVLMQTPTGAIAREYLQSRCVTDTIATSFQLGYAPDSWDSLYHYLKKKQYTDEQLIATGLVVEGARGPYDRFRGRLMFPIYNAMDQVIGFSGRLIKSNPSEKDGGKYVNTPETLVYHKRESLYGIHKAREAIRKMNKVIVVEGEFDMIAPYTKGIEHVVAIKGSAFTTEQLKTLRRYCDKLILALDADAAGVEAMKKAAREAEPYEFQIYVCQIPGGKDPDEAIQHDLLGFKQALEKAIPIYDYLIETYAKMLDLQDPFSKKRFAEGILPYIDSIKNPIVKEHYIQKVSHILQTTEASVLTEIRDIRKKKKVAAAPQVSSKEHEDHHRKTGLDLLQKHILAQIVSLISGPRLYALTTTYVTAADFTVPAYGTFFQWLGERLARQPPLASDTLAGEVPPELQETYTELYLYASMIDEESDEGTIFERNVCRLARDSVKAQYSQASQLPETEINQAHIDLLQKRLMYLEKKLQTV